MEIKIIKVLFFKLVIFSSKAVFLLLMSLNSCHQRMCV